MRDASISRKTEDVIIGELALRAIEKYTLITLLPVLIVFFLSQRLFVQGVTLTGMGGR
jgi:ABC-type glycerol-3-phosphate transport system permease component